MQTATEVIELAAEMRAEHGPLVYGWPAIARAVRFSQDTMQREEQRGRLVVSRPSPRSVVCRVGELARWVLGR